ncbi:MAG: hypothetical protein V1800_01965 [Candidatus Latescibacterota bacterium]
MLPLFALILASLTGTSPNLAMRYLVGKGGTAARAQTMIFAGALLPLLVIYAAQRTSVWGVPAALGAVSGSTGILAGIAYLNAMRYGKVGPTSMIICMGALVSCHACIIV